MVYTAKVEIVVWPYMEDNYTQEKFHTVEAESEDEAEEKINAHYKAKSTDYGTSYGVNGVEFFEHIP